MEEQLIFICECFSHEHQCIFWYDKEDEMFLVTVHLTTHDNVFKRIWTAIKYIFGYTSRYGAWDDFVMKPVDQQKLRDYLTK